MVVIEWGILRTIINAIRSVICRLNCKKSNKNNQNQQTRDSILFNDYDVELERKQIEMLDSTQPEVLKSYPLIVRNLVKQFGHFTAVNHISYTVKKGECFGMLGVNGAGKTTTFKMITGDEEISSGDIFVNGLNICKNLHQAQQEMGYCPQFDSVLDDLTGRETLTLYSRLRGIKECDIAEQIKDLSHLLYFEMHVDKLVAQYSGGNKRKLSTAIVSAN